MHAVIRLQAEIIQPHPRRSRDSRYTEGSNNSG